MTEGERHQQVTEPDWSGDEDELLPVFLVFTFCEQVRCMHWVE